MAAMTDAEYAERLEAFKKLSSAWMAPCMVLSAIELGVFDALDGQVLGAGALAERLGVDPRCLDALMDAIVSLGYLERRDGGYANTPFGARAFVRSSPSYEGDSAILSLGCYRAAAPMAEV